MSQYTTGELAKKCGVSVRTVQYYDERGILVPTALTEGGRRLFSDEDADTLKTICFLRDLDISIKDIAEILVSQESKKIIELLIDDQTQILQEDIRKKTEQLDKIRSIKELLPAFRDGSKKTLYDISSIMEERKTHRKLTHWLIGIAALMEMAVLAALVIGILKGVWIPLLVVVAVYGVVAGLLFAFWYKRIEYICPECHSRYRPRWSEALWANHTARTRKLTCPHCKRKIWSLEVYRKAEKA